MGDGVVEIFEYNAFNQNSFVLANGKNVQYDYRPDGLRNSKMVDNTTTTHLWNGQNVVADVGETTVNYVRGLGLIANDLNGANNYYLFNAHGDTVQLIDENGNITQDYTYDAFGNQEVIAESDNNPFRYAGEYFDSESGNIYLRARYYDTNTGRFTQLDPHWNTQNMLYGDSPQQTAQEVLLPNMLAMQQSGNRYVYGVNNPVMYVDESGEVAMLATIAIGAGIGAVIGGGIELGTQLWSGRTFSEVEWGKVGIQATSSAVSGGLAGSGVGLIGQIAGNAAISSISNASTQKVYTGNIDFEEVALSAGIGAFIGLAGGSGVFKGANKVHVDYIMEGSHLLRRSVFHYVDPKVSQVAMGELKKGMVKSGAVGYTLSWVDDNIFELNIEENFR